MGFREKSAWACLMGIALVFIPYFCRGIHVPDGIRRTFRFDSACSSHIHDGMSNR